MQQLVPPIDGCAADDIELVVSELVTNAVRHAQSTTCVLGLDTRLDTVEVTVTGSDPALPCPRTPDLGGGGGGFGWPMVRSLAQKVTVVSVPNGKAVCVLMPRSQRAGLPECDARQPAV
ncbi:hypothetical protein GCM10010524_10990 [Streptomyces mexicanus]|jgi:anti-sigma regulatory factor (Ser/Thr protein kinase)